MGKIKIQEIIHQKLITSHADLSHRYRDGSFYFTKHFTLHILRRHIVPFVMFYNAIPIATKRDENDMTKVKIRVKGTLRIRRR